MTVVLDPTAWEEAMCSALEDPTMRRLVQRHGLERYAPHGQGRVPRNRAGE